MNIMGASPRLMAIILLPVLILSACSGPAAVSTSVPTAVVVATEVLVPTETRVPPTPTRVPPTETAVSPTATVEPTATLTPQGEGEIVVMAAFIQVDRGFLGWVDDFTAKTECKVTLLDFIDYAQALPVIEAGGIDIVMGGLSSYRLIKDGLVEEIDVTRLPSWGKVSDELSSSSSITVDQKIYGVPYQWIPNVLIYHTGVFPTPPQSWGVVFEEQTLPDGKSNSKRVLAPYEMPYIGSAALYLGSKIPSTGIKDPYQLTETQLTETMAVLGQQKSLLSAYYDDKLLLDGFKNKGSVVAQGTPRLVKLLADEGVPVSSTIPQEGSTALMFSNLLVKGAPHSVCAYQWIEYSIDARVQADTAAKFGANPSVPVACEEDSELLSAEACERNGVGKESSFSFMQTPQNDCRTGANNCVAVGRWAEEFTILVTP